MDIMDIMDIRDIMEVMEIMDIMDIMNIMDIMIITVWLAMAGAVSALVVLGFQAVTRGENKLPHAQYTSDPQYYYRFWTPYKIIIRGAD